MSSLIGESITELNAAGVCDGFCDCDGGDERSATCVSGRIFADGIT
jgi:hypothetical protein